MNRPSILKYALAFVLPATLIVTTFVPSRRAQAQASPRVVEITAKRFGFTPNAVTVKRGETVVLRLKSEDVTHGFFTRVFKIDEDLEPGKTTDVTITPQTAGTYTIICDHFCGANHGNMNMTMVVE